MLQSDDVTVTSLVATGARQQSRQLTSTAVLIAFFQSVLTHAGPAEMKGTGHAHSTYTQADKHQHKVQKGRLHKGNHF